MAIPDSFLAPVKLSEYYEVVLMESEHTVVNDLMLKYAVAGITKWLSFLCS